jgi:hypothetical protein
MEGIPGGLKVYHRDYRYTTGTTKILQGLHRYQRDYRFTTGNTGILQGHHRSYLDITWTIGVPPGAKMGTNSLFCYLVTISNDH